MKEMGRFFYSGYKKDHLTKKIFRSGRKMLATRGKSIFATGLLIAYVNPINRIRCSERVFAFQITHSVFIILKYEFRIF